MTVQSWFRLGARDALSAPPEGLLCTGHWRGVFSHQWVLRCQHLKEICKSHIRIQLFLLGPPPPHFSCPSKGVPPKPAQWLLVGAEEPTRDTGPGEELGKHSNGTAFLADWLHPSRKGQQRSGQ